MVSPHNHQTENSSYTLRQLRGIAVERLMGSSWPCERIQWWPLALQAHKVLTFLVEAAQKTQEMIGHMWYAFLQLFIRQSKMQGIRIQVAVTGVFAASPPAFRPLFTAFQPTMLAIKGSCDTTNSSSTCHDSKVLSMTSSPKKLVSNAPFNAMQTYAVKVSHTYKSSFYRTFIFASTILL